MIQVADATDPVRTHLEERVRSLTRVLDGAAGERQLAMFRLYQHGVTVANIARMMCEDIGVVSAEIDAARRDPNMDDFAEGPSWVEFWPHHGGRVSG